MESNGLAFFYVTPLIQVLDHTYPVGLLWTIDQLVPEAAACSTDTKTNIRALGEIRTRDSSSQSAGDLCRRPHDRGLRTTFSFHYIFVNLIQHYAVQRFGKGGGGGITALRIINLDNKWKMSRLLPRPFYSWDILLTECRVGARFRPDAVKNVNRAPVWDWMLFVQHVTYSCILFPNIHKNKWTQKRYVTFQIPMRYIYIVLRIFYEGVRNVFPWFSFKCQHIK
jgi:hypothetical protein